MCMYIFIMVHLIGVKVYGFSHNFRERKGNKIEIRGLSINLHFAFPVFSYPTVL